MRSASFPFADTNLALLSIKVKGEFEDARVTGRPLSICARAAARTALPPRLHPSFPSRSSTVMVRQKSSEMFSTLSSSDPSSGSLTPFSAPCSISLRMVGR